MYNNFASAVNYEATQMPIANQFYKRMGITNIRRCSWNTKGGKINQLNDIDLICRWNGRVVKISEKFRTSDWDDFAIEICKDIYRVKQGSYIVSKADYIFYHTPTKLYILNTHKLQQWLNDRMLDRGTWVIMSTEAQQSLLDGNKVEWRGQNFRLFETFIRGERKWKGLCVLPLKTELNEVIEGVLDKE